LACSLGLDPSAALAAQLSADLCSSCFPDPKVLPAFVDSGKKLSPVTQFRPSEVCGTGANLTIGQLTARRLGTLFFFLFFFPVFQQKNFGGEPFAFPGARHQEKNRIPEPVKPRAGWSAGIFSFFATPRLFRRVELLRGMGKKKRKKKKKGTNGKK